MGRRFPIAYSGLIPVGKKCGNQRQGHLVSRIWRCTAAGISKQTAALGNFHASRLQCGPGYGQGMPLVPLNMLFLNRSHPHCGSRTSSLHCLEVYQHYPFSTQMVRNQKCHNGHERRSHVFHCGSWGCFCLRIQDGAGYLACTSANVCDFAETSPNQLQRS